MIAILKCVLLYLGLVTIVGCVIGEAVRRLIHR